MSAPIGARAGDARGGWRDPAAVSYRRSVVLMAVGAIAGLALPGYGLVTARGTSTLAVPPEDVAMVNQQPLSRSDFDALLRTTYMVDPSRATPAQRRGVLDAMVREELLVQRAKELDVASVDPDVRSAMAASVEQEVAADATTSQPADAKLRAYFEAHRSRYASEGSMTVLDLVFPSTLLVGQALEALRGGAAPADALARLHGRDSRRTKGEEFYFAAKIHLGDKDFAQVRALPERGLAGPVAEPDGFHLFYMVQNRPPVPYDFETARAQVLTDYRGDAVERLRSGDDRFFRKRANILVAKDLQG